MINSYKTIFRIDYPLSFNTVDNLGTFSETIHLFTQEVPFEKTKTDIKLNSHEIINRGWVCGDPYKYQLNLDSLFAIIEHNNGFNINGLHKSPLIRLTDKLLEENFGGSLKQINRFGLRFWIIFQRQEFTFEALKNLFVSKLKFLDLSLKEAFSETNDIGIVLESELNKKNKTRINLGPYKKEEWQKYFLSDPEIEQGLIFDIDFFEASLEVPGFRFERIVSHFQEKIHQITNNIFNSILGELNEG